MKTTLLSVIILFLISPFAVGQQQPSDTGFCEIWNNEEKLVGIATRQGKIAQYDYENETYKVVGLSHHDNSVKLVKTYDTGRPIRQLRPLGLIMAART